MGKTETATLAGGCFWCTEAIFKRVKGVQTVSAGYAGGKTAKPTYQTVSSGQTGHTESIQISFDPEVISYEKLLEIFFKLHDPTTLNQQGADIGTQYRSVVFYHNRQQKEVAERVEKRVEQSGLYRQPLVTEIVPYSGFYLAEESHQDYYAKNPTAPYCRVVIDPKIQKLMESFKPQVKTS
jgi:peptide-methionine (S)-S-oxide reductase